MNEKSKLCTAALVWSIVGLCLFLLGGLGFIPSVVGLILAIICLAKKYLPKGKALTSLFLSIGGIVLNITASIFAVILAITLMAGASTFKDAFDEAFNDTYGYSSNDDYWDEDEEDSEEEDTDDDSEEEDTEEEIDESESEDFFSEVYDEYGAVPMTGTISGVSFYVPADFYYTRGDGTYSVYMYEDIEYEVPAYVFDCSGDISYDNFGQNVRDSWNVEPDSEVADIDICNDEVGDAGSWHCGTFNIYNEYHEFTVCVLAYSYDGEKVVVLMARPESEDDRDDTRDTMLRLVEGMRVSDF